MNFKIVSFDKSQLNANREHIEEVMTVASSDEEADAKIHNLRERGHQISYWLESQTEEEEQRKQR